MRFEGVVCASGGLRVGCGWLAGSNQVSFGCTLETLQVDFRCAPDEHREDLAKFGEPLCTQSRCKVTN